MQLPSLPYWWDFSHISIKKGRQAMENKNLGGVGVRNTQKTGNFLNLGFFVWFSAVYRFLINFL